MKNFYTSFFITIFFSNVALAQTICVPTFSGNTTFIDNFAFHTIVNTYSGVDNSDQFVFYSDSIFTTAVTLGLTYPITISSDIPSGVHGKYAAWIDYNNDSLFDSTELIHYDSVSHHSTSGFVTIPNNNNIIGLKRLRVVCAWTTSTVTPCGNYMGGECEDYLINIVSNQPDSQTYCMPFNPLGMNNFTINNFHIDNLINDNSGADSTSYIFYPSSQFSVNLFLNNSYIVHISKGTSAGNTGGYAVWIDLNNDGEFSNSERLFYDGPFLTSTTGTITIPNDTSIIGSHRLRVRSQWGDVPTNPCGLFDAGETEDYMINILGTVTSIENSYLNKVEFQVFPNPSNGNFRIESDVNNGRLEIYTSIGERIFSEPISISSKKEINLKNISSGIYFIKIFDSEKFYVRQIIIE